MRFKLATLECLITVAAGDQDRWAHVSQMCLKINSRFKFRLAIVTGPIFLTLS